MTLPTFGPDARPESEALIRELYALADGYSEADLASRAALMKQGDLPLLLRESSPVLYQALCVLRTCLVHRCLIYNPPFLFGLLLELLATLVERLDSHIPEIQAVLELLFMMLEAQSSADQCVNTWSMHERCDASTLESGGGRGPCWFVTTFATLIQTAEYSPNGGVRTIAALAANVLASFIVSPFFRLEASTRARYTRTSCRYINLRTHEADNHRYLLLYLASLAGRSRTMIHLIRVLMDYTPMVGLYNPDHPSAQRSSWFNQLGSVGILSHRSQPGSDAEEIVKASEEREREKQRRRQPVRNCRGREAVSPPQSHASSVETNTTSAHIPPVTLETLSFYPFLSCFTGSFDLCPHCKGRLLDARPTDPAESHNTRVRERVFECDRCYSAYVLENVSICLIRALEYNRTQKHEVISVDDIMSILGRVLLCHQASLVYFVSAFSTGCAEEQLNANAQHRLHQMQALTHHLQNELSIGGFYKSECLMYSNLYQQRLRLEQEYSQLGVPLATDFPVPSAFGLLGSQECLCQKARSLRTRNVTGAGSSSVGGGVLASQHPIQSCHLFHAVKFLETLPRYSPNPLRDEFDPFELSLVFTLRQFFVGPRLDLLLGHIRKHAQSVYDAIQNGCLRPEYIERVICPALYTHGFILHTLLDYLWNYDLSKFQLSIPAKLYSLFPYDALERVETTTNLTLSDEARQQICTIACLVYRAAALIEPEVHQLGAYTADHIYLPYVEDGRMHLPPRPVDIPTGPYRTTAGLSRAAMESDDVRENLFAQLFAWHHVEPNGSPRFSIISSPNFLQSGLGKGTTDAAAGDDQRGAEPKTVAGLLQSTSDVYGDGDSRAEASTIVQNTPHASQVQGWDDVMSCFRTNLIRTVYLHYTTGASALPTVPSIVYRMIVGDERGIFTRMSVAVTSHQSSTAGLEPFGDTRGVDPWSIPATANGGPRGRLAGFFEAKGCEPVVCRTFGLPYSLPQRTLPPSALRQPICTHAPERLFLHAALASVYIGLVSVPRTRQNRAGKLFGGVLELLDQSLFSMYYSLLGIQLSKYTLRFFGSNLFADHDFDPDRIRAAARTLNVLVSSEQTRYFAYVRKHLHGTALTEGLGETEVDVEGSGSIKDTAAWHHGRPFLDYLPHTTEFPCISSSSYYAQCSHLLDAGFQALGLCTHTIESYCTIGPAVICNDRLHPSSDASCCDHFAPSRCVGRSGLTHPAVSMLAHPATMPHRYMLYRGFPTNEGTFFRNVLRCPAAHRHRHGLFDFFESFLTVHAGGLSLFLTTFSTTHLSLSESVLGSRQLKSLQQSFPGVAASQLFGSFNTILQNCGFSAPAEVVGPTRSLGDVGFAVHLILELPLSDRTDPLYISPITDQCALYSGVDSRRGGQGFVIEHIERSFAVLAFDLHLTSDDLEHVSFAATQLNVIQAVSSALGQSPTLIYNPSALKLACSVLRALSLSVQVVGCDDYVTQLALCEYVSRFIASYGLTHLAISLAEVTLGLCSSYSDLPSSTYRRIRTSASVDTFFDSLSGSGGSLFDEQHLRFVDMSDPATELIHLSTLFYQDPALVIDTRSGSVIVLNLELGNVLLLPFSVFVSARWFYAQLHALIFRYARLLLLADCTSWARRSLEASQKDHLGHHMRCYGRAVIALQGYLQPREVLYRVRFGDTGVISAPAALQYGFFVDELRKLQRRLYARVYAAVMPLYTGTALQKYRVSLARFQSNLAHRRLQALAVYVRECDKVSNEVAYRSPTTSQPSTLSLALSRISICDVSRDSIEDDTVDGYRAAFGALPDPILPYFDVLQVRVGEAVDTAFADITSEAFTGAVLAPDAIAPIALANFIAAVDIVFASSAVIVPEAGFFSDMLCGLGLVHTLAVATEFGALT
ncbi:hypothetical protein GMRT_12368 [Giardia muris]|uniref:Uncharacterized protein n=1 Tax=Giardia muris TaxID=5742 RepID=A0A4Z1SQR5_GIAMU|nr:hypothetical protein GMRT_12368 [Giardia muris]|eukprot:TNJ27275.1 hypothetical protein GMRT_12368 [Giardia muris]